MKNSLILILLVAFFSGCCKLKKDPCMKFKGYHKFIYEPIEISEDCNSVFALAAVAMAVVPISIFSI